MWVNRLLTRCGVNAPKYGIRLRFFSASRQRQLISGVADATQGFSHRFPDVDGL
jgi:hypothetical protein